jgi:enoyl-CoA hydratase/carnithine racemase
MVLGGEVFTAEQGLPLGLVDQVVEPGKALEAAMAYAANVASRGPAATQTAKLMIAAATGDAPEMAIDTIASILAAKTADLREGVEAFGNKRAAAFTGDW